MTHIDEHTLELFVVSPDALGGAASEVESHLAVCSGCSLLAEQIRSFYLQAEEAVTRENGPASALNRSLVIRKEHSPDIFTSFDRLPARRWVQEGGIIRRFARRHPIASGTGAFAILAASFAALFVFLRGPSDKNPAYTHLNPSQEMLEVYNAQHERLWTLPAQDIEGALQQEARFEVPCTQVADLDGSGRRQVISLIRLSSDQKEQAPLLRVFESDKKERFRLKLGSALSFLGASYNEEYNPGSIAISSLGTNGRRELFVSGTNNRSPSVITRVSSSGEVLGEYWHFGALYGVAAVTLRGEPRILAWGTNDVSDAVGHFDRSFAMIVLLDPSKIIGRTESVCTRGFGLPPSSAEDRYIRLPRSDMEEALGLPAATKRLVIERDSMLTFTVNGGAFGKDAFSFFYSFRRDLTPLEVKSDETTEDERRRLEAKGFLKSSWTQSYFDSLKSRIEFLR